MVANSKKVGCHFQRQTKPCFYAVRVLNRPSKIKLGEGSLTCYKVDTRMDYILRPSSPEYKMHPVNDRDACATHVLET